MGRELDLLRSLPLTQRDVEERAAPPEERDRRVRIACKYGSEYFDGARQYGYGGYWYDGRWRSVARDILRHYFPDDCRGGVLTQAYRRVLDVGCAKGFLVHDLCAAGADAYGLDVSRHAVCHYPHPPAVGRLHLGSADALPFPDQSFDLVISLDTVHNLPRERCKLALQEITRVSRGPAFVTVDAYVTKAERLRLEKWILTAQFWGSTDEWLTLFREAKYLGDYCWTKV